jgi:hypothetical protein
MKSENGVTTKAQKDFLRGVLEEGYCAVIAQGFDDAVAALSWYIAISDKKPASVLNTAQTCLDRSYI